MSRPQWTGKQVDQECVVPVPEKRGRREGKRRKRVCWEYEGIGTKRVLVFMDRTRRSGPECRERTPRVLGQSMGSKEIKCKFPFVNNRSSPDPRSCPSPVTG